MKGSPDIITPQDTPTLSMLFKERIRRTPDNTAYHHFDKLSDSWQKTSWKDMGKKTILWKNGFSQEQLKPGDRVAIMLPNSPDWVCFDQAAHALGLVVVPLYVNDRPDNVAYILNDTEAKLFVCPGMVCYEQLTPVLEKLHPQLQRIITIDDCNLIENDPRVVCITEWLPESSREIQDQLGQPEDVATIVYTSGTTGPPKGVMLSHKNILANVYAGLQCMDVYANDLFLSFLPLSHMLERTVGYYLPIMAGAGVAFARSIPQLGEDLVTIQPTILIAVPRIFERVYSNMHEKIHKGPQITKTLFQLATELGWQKFQVNQKRASYTPKLLFAPLLDLLVGKKVRDKLGGRLRIIISGGAPLSHEIAKVFISLGLPIYQGYGLTETSPIISVNRQDNNNPAGVGLPLPGVEVKIDKLDELLVKGDNVMLGYYNNPDATNKTIDPDGWLFTGDRAVIENGHIRIIGRIKEIIVLSNGEKVAPGDVEMAIGMDPLFEQTLVVGEGKPFLMLIAVLAKERWKLLAEELGVPPTEESLQLESVQQEILNRIEKLMSNFPAHAFIKHATLSLNPWTVEEGLLTPTLKVKRKNVIEMLQDEIDAVYTD